MNKSNIAVEKQYQKDLAEFVDSMEPVEETWLREFVDSMEK